MDIECRALHFTLGRERKRKSNEDLRRSRSWNWTWEELFCSAQLEEDLASDRDGWKEKRKTSSLISFHCLCRFGLSFLPFLSLLFSLSLSHTDNLSPCRGGERRRKLDWARRFVQLAFLFTFRFLVCADDVTCKEHLVYFKPLFQCFSQKVFSYVFWKHWGSGERKSMSGFP